MANGFGAPLSPYPDTGGDPAMPQPGTPEFYQWLQSIGRGPPAPDKYWPSNGVRDRPAMMAGGAPQGPLAQPFKPYQIAGAMQPPPASADASQQPGAFANASSAAYPDEIGPERGMSTATAASIPTSGIMPIAAVDKRVDSSRGVQSKTPVKRAPPAAADDSMLYPFKAIGGAASANAGPQGAVDAAAPKLSPAASNVPWPNQIDPSGVWGQRPSAAVTPVADPAMLYPHRMISGIPGAPSNGAVPNLGYYRPTSGNVRGGGWGQPGPTWTPYTDPNDPRIFRGPLASR